MTRDSDRLCTLLRDVGDELLLSARYNPPLRLLHNQSIHSFNETVWGKINNPLNITLGLIGEVFVMKYQ